MGIMERMATILRAKMRGILDQTDDDPSQTLDSSYEKQIQLLQNVKRGVVDVVTSKRRLELQAARLRDSTDKIDDQARRALTSGREDLARVALGRKQEILRQLETMEGQIGELEQEKEKLTINEQRLALKIEAFRTRKETIRAQYSAAEAQVKIGEAASGIGEEMADVGMAIERAEEKTKRLKARAAAIDEMVDEGLLPDFTSSGRIDVVDRQMAKLESEDNVERELAALKQQMGASHGQLPAGDDQEGER